MSDRNYGLDLNRERAEQTPDDWQFGGESQPGLISIPLSEREQWLPKGEVQRGQEDFQSCASISPTNHLEALFTYGFQKKLIDEDNRKWLEEKGYLNADGKITFSDRFTAVLSQTTRQGNSLKAPLESIRKNGLIPKRLLPASKEMTFDDYHSTAAITKELRDLGIEFTRRFVINYEQVNRLHFAEALKEDMLGVAAHAWSFPENGVYPQTDAPLNHAFVLYNLPKYQAYDSYEESAADFTKNLASDYVFFDTGYRVYISKINGPYDRQINWQAGIDALVLQLKYALELIGFLKKQQPLPVTPTPMPTPKPPANNLINALILAMRRHEGWFTGSRSQRNNNPLNCRYSRVGYASVYGTVKRDAQNFAIFSTYELGHLYAKNLILGKAKKHPDWNLVQFIGDEREGWAPASDNNDVDRYATVLAEALGVSKTAWKLSNLLS